MRQMDPVLDRHRCQKLGSISEMVHSPSPLERIFRPDAGTLSAELAEYILQIDFPEEDHAIYEQLSAKAQEGTLTESERAQLDELLTANDVLTILQSKARASLQRRTPAA
jgi:hypothetical protein